MARRFLLVLILGAVAAICSSAWAGPVHVAPARGEGVRDGRSWATAFATVQEGIDAAAKLGGGEVWVAAGIYRPIAGGDRSVSIQMRKGVEIYGGFAGSEARREERDWEKNATILSGDVGRQGINTDNSYRVVTGADEAVLDGFVITGAYALDARGMGPPPGGRGGRPGGAPIHTSPDAILQGLQPGTGGGMANFQCAPTIRNCTFTDNHAGKGGAMYNMSSREFPPRHDSAAPAPLIVNCRFIGNSARGRGGAVANDLGTSPTFRGCTFIDNACDGKGGAIYNDFGCSPVLANCLFAANRATSAGAIGNDGASSPLIVHCTFTGNIAVEEGAALYQGTGPANNPTVIGCILWANRCENGPAEVFNWHDNDPRITGSCIQGGTAGEGNFDKDPRFADPDKGDYRLAADSPCKSIGHAAAVSDERLAKLMAERPRPARMGRPDELPRPRPGALTGPAQVVYVDAAAKAAAPDGNSWATAFASLQEAIAATKGPAEIRVARGTYRPSASDRNASFVLREGLSLYGGFRGDESSRDQRDPASNATILSGDIGRPGDASDNSLHVVVGADGAVIDGFTIRDGNADGSTYDGKGGGLINYARGPQAGPMGAPTGFSTVVRNCAFIANRAREGGAVYNYDRGSPQFIDCRFVENSADYGGAMVDRVGVRSMLQRCIFERNAARWRAGAIYLDYGARPQLTDCRFIDNRSDCHGGAIAAVSRASQLENTIAALKNCSFAGNAARKRGGAIASADSAILGLDACSFSNNRAAGGSAVAGDTRARLVLVDCGLGEGQIAADPSVTVSRDRRDWPDQAASPRQRR